MSEWQALLLVLGLGFAPTAIWRALAVLAARRLDPDSEILAWVRAVATTLLAAVVAKLLLAPSGALAAIPRPALFGALALAVAGFFALRRSLVAALVIGEAAILALAWFYGARV